MLQNHGTVDTGGLQLLDCLLLVVWEVGLIPERCIYSKTLYSLSVCSVTKASSSNAVSFDDLTELVIFFLYQWLLPSPVLLHTLVTYPVVHLNCTKNPLSHDVCISIYDDFFQLVCNTGWFVLVPYRCFSVIVISETICISLDFFSPVFYITLSYITLH